MLKVQRETYNNNKITYIIFKFRKTLNFCLNNVWPVILIFAFTGVGISYSFKLTLNEDAWFWFFSSIIQTFAALVALVAIFLVSRLELYNVKINDKIILIRNLMEEVIPQEKNISYNYFLSTEILLKTVDDSELKLKSFKKGPLILITREEIRHLEKEKKRAIGHMKLLLKKIVLIIGLSTIVLPLGSISIGNYLILTIWNSFKFKCLFIFGFTGFLVVTLYDISVALGTYLTEKK